MSEEKSQAKGIDQLFGMNKNLEKDGIIIDYGVFRVRIARAGGSNKRFTNVFQKKMQPLRRQVETDTLDDAVASKVMAEAYADAVILDMDVQQEDGSYASGIMIGSGEVLEFNKKNVVDTLVNYPEFFRDLQSQANQVSLFRESALEEDVKN